ncbi:hypothetical protein A7U43_13250 [Mycobacterium adipatum]|uniref:Peptidase M41 domain-containing protein n=1 Tax=Mycobacterium adipatum TaxID=1682113 RepID=A0A172UM65_9MYCO|nr:hypothetical protein [Mycobacterium adipatum]ANE80153.1 hypothetical protein A7U43_13250 [Mycobacterium adipatum]
MTDLFPAELVATVASAAVKATLAASGGGLKTPKTPTPSRPVRPSLAPARPVRPTHQTRATAEGARRDRLAVAVHEAGHAVGGVVLGAELRSAVLPPEGVELRGGLKGQTFFNDQAAHHDPQVAYAGPWAEAKFHAGGRRPTQRQFYAVMDSHGCHDRRVLTAAGGTHEGSGVVPILHRCWPAVLTVARTLHHVGEIHQEDVLSALGVTDGGGPFSVQLASLRSGGHSVPPFNPKTRQPA